MRRVVHSVDPSRRPWAARTRPARKRLRRALPPLKQVLRRLRSRATGDVPSLLRDRLVRDVETLQGNVRGLAARLACPADAEAG